MAQEPSNTLASTTALNPRKIHKNSCQSSVTYASQRGSEGGREGGRVSKVTGVQQEKRMGRAHPQTARNTCVEKNVFIEPGGYT